MQPGLALTTDLLEQAELDGAERLGPFARVLAWPVLAGLDRSMKALRNRFPRVADGAQLGGLAEHGLQVVAHG
ncbi:MAG TPA: hypothetical protein VKE40_08295 [Gemmataceae bacterium]|nr:hypothetical protein [Gemmataceae bacterium]